MLLADLAWIWCGASSPGTDLPPQPNAAHLIVASDAGELADAARSLSAPLCLVILSDIHPWPTVGTLSPDPALTASGRPLMYPAMNALTGDSTPHQGLWVLSPSLVAEKAELLVSGAAAQALAPLVPPSLAATWECDTTPEAAFRAGHAAMLDAPRGPALALTASLGADRPNGLWWGIGAARALLGDATDSAWSDESALSLPAGDLSARRAELARMVRVRCGLPMHPLNADAAAALRRMRAPVASPLIWDRYTAELQALMPGAINADVLKGHSLARAVKWGLV